MANSTTAKTKSNGLTRLFSRYYYKMVREKATPEYIAGGWALGMFCGCAIPMGLQLMISVPLAFMFRLSKIGATVGTLITNHFTIFIIYPFQCWLGQIILGKNHTYHDMLNMLKDLLADPTWAALRRLGTELVASFLIGGLAMAIVLTPLTYWLVYRTVVRYRATCEQRRALRERLMQKLHRTHGDENKSENSEKQQ